MIFPNKNVAPNAEFEFFVEKAGQHKNAVVFIDIDYLLNNNYSVMVTAGKTSGSELLTLLSNAYKRLCRIMPDNKIIVYFSDVLEPDVRKYDRTMVSDGDSFSDSNIPSFNVWKNCLAGPPEIASKALTALNLYLFDRMTFCTCVWRKKKTALQCIFSDFMYGANFVITSNSAAFSYAILQPRRPNVYYYVFQKHFSAMKVLDSEHFINFIRRSYTPISAHSDSSSDSDSEEAVDSDDDYQVEPKPILPPDYPWEIVYCIVYAFLCNADHCPYGKIGRPRDGLSKQRKFNCSADKLMKYISYYLKRDNVELFDKTTGKLNDVFITKVVCKLKNRKGIDLTYICKNASELISMRLNTK